MRVPSTAAWALLLVGCAGVDPAPRFDDARSLIEVSTGRAESFDPRQSGPTESELDALLEDGLSLAETERLVLVNSRPLAAQFHRLGAAHAAEVQARLLSNPSLQLLLRSPVDGGRALIEGAIGFGLSELWRLPAAAGAARAEADAAVFQTARLAGEELAQARESFHRACFLDRSLAVEADLVGLQREFVDANARGVELGALDRLALEASRSDLLNAEQQLALARLAAQDARRTLGEQLGLVRSLDSLRFEAVAPSERSELLSTESLVDLALRTRLDLRALDCRIEALGRDGEVQRRSVWSGIELGLSYERGEDGAEALGPAVGLELPLFDRNRAQIARAAHELATVRALREAAAAAVAQEVRSAADGLATAEDRLNRQRSEVIPTAERALALAQQALAAGSVTRITWLERRRALLRAERGLAALELEVALARTGLERALGVPLDAD